MSNLSINDINNRNLDSCLINVIVIPTKVSFKVKERIINYELYSFFGTNINGKRVYLTTIIKDYYNKTSSWYDLLLSLKNKGINNIFYAVIPNNLELSKALKLAFNEINIFISYFDTINKLNKYYSNNYSNSLESKVYKLYLSKDISDYELIINEFKEEYLNIPFISDLVHDDLIRIKQYINHDYEFRKFIFSFFFFRDTSKVLRSISNSKDYFSSIDEFVQKLLPFIQKIEKAMFCSKNTLKYIINILYANNKELIKYYL